MTDSHLRDDGLWRNNPALVQLLGLCPLLAVSQQLVTALALGLVTLIVLTISNLSISLFRRFLISDIRLPLQILVIATLVSAADLLLQAFFFRTTPKDWFVCCADCHQLHDSRPCGVIRTPQRHCRIHRGWILDGAGFFLGHHTPRGHSRNHWTRNLVRRVRAHFGALRSILGDRIFLIAHHHRWHGTRRIFSLRVLDCGQELAGPTT